MPTIQEKIEKIEENIANLKENHLAHMQVDLARLGNNVDWLMRFFWIIATASVGGLITGLITLLK